MNFQQEEDTFLQEADLAMGVLSRTASRDTVVDFSYPYFISRIGFYTRKPTLIPKYMAIMWPFGEIVWLLVALSVLMFSFLFWTFSKIDKNGFPPNYNFTKAILEASQMLVNQGMDVRHGG